MNLQHLSSTGANSPGYNLAKYWTYILESYRRVSFYDRITVLENIAQMEIAQIEHNIPI
jgi:hypothetical protein